MPSCEMECYWLRCLVVQRGIVWWDGLTDLLREVLDAVPKDRVFGAIVFNSMLSVCFQAET